MYRAAPARTGANTYVSINVYPSSGGWRCAAFIRTAGQPNSRLDRRLLDVALPSDTKDLRGALQAASTALLNYRDALPFSPGP